MTKREPSGCIIIAEGVVNLCETKADNAAIMLDKISDSQRPVSIVSRRYRLPRGWVILGFAALSWVFVLSLGLAVWRTWEFVAAAIT